MDSWIDERARDIRAVVFDVDGVLTRGDILMGPETEWRIFNEQDGHGMKMARRAGLKIAMLTGRAAEATRRRAREIQVDAFAEGALNKGEILPGLLAEMQVSAKETCYVGDDLVDLPPMRMVGMPVAVHNAVAEVKAAAVWTTSRGGGEGAAREVLERILKARGLWTDLLRAYVS